MEIFFDINREVAKSNYNKKNNHYIFTSSYTDHIFRFFLPTSLNGYLHNPQ